MHYYILNQRDSRNCTKFFRILVGLTWIFWFQDWSYGIVTPSSRVRQDSSYTGVWSLSDIRSMECDLPHSYEEVLKWRSSYMDFFCFYQPSTVTRNVELGVESHSHGILDHMIYFYQDWSTIINLYILRKLHVKSIKQHSGGLPVPEVEW